MDIDVLKSTVPDQMDMMSMMMQMDKLSELCGPYQEPSELPDMEFSGGANSSTMETAPPMFHTPLMNPSSSSISFMSTAVQEPMTPPLLPHVGSGRLKSGGGELCSANPFSAASEKKNSMAAMREMIFRIAVMQPIHIDPESVKPPKRRNVKISKDPQSVAARHRRERISERIRILQRLVPGGTKMDTASMLDEAIHYVKFLKNQVQSLEKAGAHRPPMGVVGFPATTTTMANPSYPSFPKSFQASPMLGSMQMLR